MKQNINWYIAQNVSTDDTDMRLNNLISESLMSNITKVEMRTLRAYSPPWVQFIMFCQQLTPQEQWLPASTKVVMGFLQLVGNKAAACITGYDASVKLYSSAITFVHECAGVPPH